MKSLSKLIVGDRVLIETASGHYLTMITKITNNQLYTHSSRYRKEDGRSANRFSPGFICQNEIHYKEYFDKKEKEQKEREKREQMIQIRDSRVTYQLARQIVNSVEPSASIDILEGLGEVKLKQIVEWIKKI